MTIYTDHETPIDWIPVVPGSRIKLDARSKEPITVFATQAEVDEFMANGVPNSIAPSRRVDDADFHPLEHDTLPNLEAAFARHEAEVTELVSTLTLA